MHLYLIKPKAYCCGPVRFLGINVLILVECWLSCASLWHRHSGGIPVGSWLKLPQTLSPFFVMHPFNHLDLQHRSTWWWFHVGIDPLQKILHFTIVMSGISQYWFLYKTSVRKGSYDSCLYIAHTNGSLNCTRILNWDKSPYNSKSKINLLHIAWLHNLLSYIGPISVTCRVFHCTLGECQFPLWIPGNVSPSPFSELV